MESTNQTSILQANKHYQAAYTHANLPVAPTRKLAIVTCIDSRLDPAGAYGLSLGASHMIRNAGGSAREALRSLLISIHVDGVEEVFVVKHTGCGLLGASNEEIARVVGQKVPMAGVGEVDFMPFADLERAVREDVVFLREHALVADRVRVTGWVHEVETGRLRLVED